MIHIIILRETFKFLALKKKFLHLKDSRSVRQRVSNSGGNFSVDEDINLVSAWLNTSMNAVQGIDQKSKTF